MHLGGSLISKLPHCKCMLNKLIIRSSQAGVKILFVILYLAAHTHPNANVENHACLTRSIFSWKKTCNLLGLLCSDWSMGWTSSILWF